MAYFNHAFLKCFNPTSVAVGREKTFELAPGQIALVQDGIWEQAATPADGTLGYIVQGSYHTVDSIGNNPGHGGYTESVKSKGINPRFISRLYSTDCITAEKSTSQITVGPRCVPCGESLYLRLDVKGSPALRFLNHNAYAIGDSANVCCVVDQTYIDPAAALAAAGGQLLADPLISPFVRERQWGAVAAGVEITQASGLSGVDSTSTVGAGGADYTSGDIVSIDTGSSLAVVRVTFTAPGGAVAAFEVLASGSGYSAATLGTTNIEVANPAAAGFTVDVVVDTDLETYSIAQVADGTYTPSTDPVGDAVSATLHVEGAYTETKFGNCSFDTRDFYGKEPVQIIASVLDETGDPCSDCGTVVNTPGTMASTIGETVLRDILMTEAYMQSPYNQGNVDSSRIREIEGSNDILASVDRTALYKTYVIQHTVPRFNNPTGVFDNDQYLYKIYVKCDDEETIQNLEELMFNITSWANRNGNPVQFVSNIDGSFDEGPVLLP